MKTRVFAVCAVIFLFCGIAGISMATTAYISPLGNGNQDFSGSLGMDFDVNQSIQVTHIGVFEPGQNGISNGTTLTVQLWSRNNNGTPSVPYDDTGIEVLVSQTFTLESSGTLDGASVFKSITPKNIAPGSYSIVAYGYNGSEPNGNEGNPGFVGSVDDGGGLITFVGLSRFSGSIGVFPEIVDGGSSNRYGAGTFKFNGINSSQIVKPYTFTSGTSAKAAEVNADFDVLYTRINALNAIVCQDHPTASICQ
jgi:hypothetical protein